MLARAAVARRTANATPSSTADVAAEWPCLGGAVPDVSRYGAVVFDGEGDEYGKEEDFGTEDSAVWGVQRLGDCDLHQGRYDTGCDEDGGGEDRNRCESRCEAKEHLPRSVVRRTALHWIEATARYAMPPTQMVAEMTWTRSVAIANNRMSSRCCGVVAGKCD